MNLKGEKKAPDCRTNSSAAVEMGIYYSGKEGFEFTAKLDDTHSLFEVTSMKAAKSSGVVWDVTVVDSTTGDSLSTVCS